MIKESVVHNCICRYILVPLPIYFHYLAFVLVFFFLLLLEI